MILQNYSFAINFHIIILLPDQLRIDILYVIKFISG